MGKERRRESGKRRKWVSGFRREEGTGDSVGREGKKLG
jgi:hypothetical protein